jgi:hypothetical protein
MNDDEALIERRKKIREEQAKIRRATEELKRLRSEDKNRDQLELFNELP